MADIEWFYPEKGKGVDKSISDIVTHFPGVEGAVHTAANSMASDAWATLMRHHRTGAAHIEVARHPRASARTPDLYVYLLDRDPGGNVKVWRNLMDRSAMSIEFGWTTKGGKEVPGLNILGGAMARAAARYGGSR